MRWRTSTSVVASLVLLGGCGKSVTELRQLDDRALGSELVSARFGTVGGGEYEQEIRTVILEKHPEWPGPIRQAITERRVILGMTNLQVATSWGAPTNSQKFLRQDGEYMTWRYGTPGPGDDMLATNASIGPTKWVHFGPNGLVTGVDQ